jgi:hypothetical protein
MHAGDTRAARNPGRGAAAPQHQPRTGRHPVHSLGIWPTSGSAQPLVAPASGPGRPRSVRAPRAAYARCRNPRLERSPRRCSSAWTTALWDGDGAITFPLNNGTITESGPHRIAIDVTDTSGSFLVGINRASATDPVHDLGFVWPGTEPAYESGPGDRTWHFPADKMDAMTALFSAAHRNLRMRDLYVEYSSQWPASGGDTMNQFNDIRRVVEVGSLGRARVGDPGPGKLTQVSWPDRLHLEPAPGAWPLRDRLPLARLPSAPRNRADCRDTTNTQTGGPLRASTAKRANLKTAGQQLLDSAAGTVRLVSGADQLPCVDAQGQAPEPQVLTPAAVPPEIWGLPLPPLLLSRTLSV